MMDRAVYLAILFKLQHIVQNGVFTQSVQRGDSEGSPIAAAAGEQAQLDGTYGTFTTGISSCC